MYSEKGEKFKRINVLVRPDQYDYVTSQGLNMSGLLRDILDDRLSDHKITLSVSSKTKKIYQQIVSNFGAEDKDIEPHFLEALNHVLKKKKAEIEKLQKDISK